MSTATTHDWRMPNGKHRGERITRIPVSYLKWMVNEGHSCADKAEAELKRRGTVTPELDVSGHAIDRASLRCQHVWRETREEDEGLHAWLCRMAADAIAHGTPHKDRGRYAWKGLSFRFEMDHRWPVLKTVMPEKSKA